MTKKNKSYLASLKASSNQPASNPPSEKLLIINGKHEDIPAAPYDVKDLSKQSAQQRLEFLQADKRQSLAKMKEIRSQQA